MRFHFTVLLFALFALRSNADVTQMSARPMAEALEKEFQNLVMQGKLRAPISEGDSDRVCFLHLSDMNVGKELSVILSASTAWGYLSPEWSIALNQVTDLIRPKGGEAIYQAEAAPGTSVVPTRLFVGSLSPDLITIAITSTTDDAKGTLACDFDTVSSPAGQKKILGIRLKKLAQACQADQTKTKYAKLNGLALKDGKTPYLLSGGRDYIAYLAPFDASVPLHELEKRDEIDCNPRATPDVASMETLN